MDAIEALKKMVAAQHIGQLALAAAIEELAIWIESNGGGQAAIQARDALKALDDSSDVIADHLKVLAGNPGIRPGTPSTP